MPSTSGVAVGQHELGGDIERDVYAIDVRRLDMLIDGKPRIDLLSIDVDGIEVDVRAGAATTRWHSERVVLEWHAPTLRAARVPLEPARLTIALEHGSVGYYRRPTGR